MDISAQHVAFLRNVNQGQRGHLSTDDVRGAFTDAGAAEAVPFQSNGTVVFTAADPDAVIADVLASLAARTGFAQPAFTIGLNQIARVVDESATAPDMGRRELTLFDASVEIVLSPAVERTAAKRRSTLLETGPGWAVTTNERDRESNATPTIEEIIGSPATSRGMPTLVRLVERFCP